MKKLIMFKPKAVDDSDNQMKAYASKVDTSQSAVFNIVNKIRSSSISEESQDFVLQTPRQNTNFKNRVGLNPSPLSSPSSTKQSKKFSQGTQSTDGSQVFFLSTPPTSPNSIKKKGSMLNMFSSPSNPAASPGMFGIKASASSTSMASLTLTSTSNHNSPSGLSSSPFPLLKDDIHEIGVMRVAYVPVDDNDDASEFSLGIGALNLATEGVDANVVGKLGVDFLDRMYVTSIEDETTISFRLQAPKSKPNRRASLVINGRIIASPKKNPTATKTQSYNSQFAGHIPRNIDFLEGNYNFLDNNISGAFPKEIANTPCDLKLLEYLRSNESEAIVEAKKFEFLVCYSERVNCYSKMDYRNNNSPIVMDPHKYNVKHYIQECRTLDATLELLTLDDENLKLHNLTPYRFDSAHDSKIIYTHNNTKFMIDLNILHPKVTPPLDARQIKTLADFQNYVVTIKQHTATNSLEKQFHTPIFYEKNGKFIPAMNQAGDDGYPITGDADSFHSFKRADMPRIVYKSFNGALDNPLKFVICLKILEARIRCSSQQLYHSELDNIKNSLESNPAIAADFESFFNFSDSKYYSNYMEIPYYSERYLGMVQEILSKYITNHELLRTIGEITVDELIKHDFFDHPLWVHGSESIHPKSKPENFGAIIICNSGNFAITANEISYIAFVLHDRTILQNQRISVHPFWLGNKEDGAQYDYAWLDILTIQALHEAAKGKSDPERGLYEFDMYHKILLESMTKGRASEVVAFAKINDRFKNLREFLLSVNFKIDYINKRIEDIYFRYSEEINEVKSALKTSASPRASMQC